MITAKIFSIYKSNLTRMVKNLKNNSRLHFVIVSRFLGKGEIGNNINALPYKQLK